MPHAQDSVQVHCADSNALQLSLHSLTSLRSPVRKGPPQAHNRHNIQDLCIVTR